MNEGDINECLWHVDKMLESRDAKIRWLTERVESITVAYDNLRERYERHTMDDDRHVEEM